MSIAVALADKIDTLVGFWAIDEKPTGSKDPYALRRAALGVIRLVLENGLRLNVLRIVDEFINTIDGDILRAKLARKANLAEQTGLDLQPEGSEYDEGEDQFETLAGVSLRAEALDLLNFFIDRLKVYLRDRGARYDLIDAALGAAAAPSSGPASQGHILPQAGEGSYGLQDDLLMITTKVDALSKFLDTEDGRNLLAGYRRAVNILKIEEKKDGPGAYDCRHAPNLRIAHEEHQLAAAISLAREETAERLKKEDFAGAMRALARLRAPVDAFFDQVTVNIENKELRLNRLRLLAELRGAMLGVADFGKIAGETAGA